MTYLFQKSFRLEHGKLVTLKSSKPLTARFVGEEFNPDGYAATVLSHTWISILAPDALCSFASEPGVRGIIEADSIISRKGKEVVVPSYTLLAVAPDDKGDIQTLRDAELDLDIFDDLSEMLEAYRPTTTRELKRAERLAH